MEKPNYFKNRKEFKDLYHKVIDSDGRMKACGRETCIDLIRLSRSLDSSNCYGDTGTGLIDKRAVIALYKRIFS